MSVNVCVCGGGGGAVYLGLFITSCINGNVLASSAEDERAAELKTHGRDGTPPKDI